MRTIRQDLLTLLIGLFIFSGCKNTNEVGLDVDPAQSVELKSIDTATIRTVTVREDTTIADGLSQYPFGYLQDPDIGNTESNLAMVLNTAITDVNFGATTVLDSAVLVLKYGNEFYGDSVNSTYRVNVHELNEVYDLNKTYYNNKTWKFGASPIGGRTVSKFYIKKNVPVTIIRVAKRDTVISQGPQLRIPLDPAYVKSRFINAPTGTYATAATFTGYFPGIYLTLNKAQSTGKGGMATFNLTASDSSGVDIYYRNITGTVIDTLVAHFSVSYASTAASIAHTYTTAVQTQLDNPSQQFSTVFVQPMAGLRTRITFPYLAKLKSLGNILINKAELIVQPISSSLDPAPRLTLYRNDIAGQRQPVPDNNAGQRSGTSPDPRNLSELEFGGFYDSTNKQYKITITSYIQDLLSGKLTQYFTYLSPLNKTNIRGISSDFAPDATTAARALIGGGNNPQFRMKLNITYTRIK